MSQHRSAGLGIGLALLSATTFSTSGSFARSLIDAGWSAEAAVTARVGVAALVLAIPAVVALRGRWRTVRTQFNLLMGYGLAAIAGAQMCYFNAIHHLPVGVALLIEYLGIVLVVGWMWLRHGQRPGRLTLAGSAVALAGLILVLNLLGSGGGLDPIGVLWASGAAVGLAAFFVMSARTDHDLPPIAMATGGMIIGGLALGLLGAVGLLPLRATFGTVTFAGHRTSWLVPILGLSVVAAVVSYLAGVYAARIVGPTLASFLGLTEVISAVIIAWLLLGELPRPIQLAGGALIIAGVALVRAGELRRKPAPSAPVPTEPEFAAPGRDARV